MKLLVIIFFALTLTAPAFSQNVRLAKSDQQYTKMYRDSNFKMARSHAQFYARAKKNQVLWKYFKDRKFALNFLKEMEFSADGLKTINLLVDDKQFEIAVGEALGFERELWLKKGKGYCCENRNCEPCSIHSKCLRSCEKKKVTGDEYDAEKVIGSGL